MGEDMSKTKDFKEIFKDLHDDNPDLAHSLLRWMLDKYGRASPEYQQLFHEELH